MNKVESKDNNSHALLGSVTKRLSSYQKLKQKIDRLENDIFYLVEYPDKQRAQHIKAVYHGTYMTNLHLLSCEGTEPQYEFKDMLLPLQ